MQKNADESRTRKKLNMSGTSQQKIALVHATPVAMAPIISAFANMWPEVDVANILDDSLSHDRALCVDVTQKLIRRIADLTNYAVGLGSSGVLYTCSAFGTAIDAAKAQHSIPVLKPNEAMFEEAFNRGENIAMLYTFAPAVKGMEAEFEEARSALGSKARLTSIFVPDAIEELRAGNEKMHNDLVATAATRLHGFDAIMLAHFSTARALDAVMARSQIPALTSPEAAVHKLKHMLQAKRTN